MPVTRVIFPLRADESVSPANCVTEALSPEVTVPLRYPVPFSITSPETSTTNPPVVSTSILSLISKSTWAKVLGPTNNIKINIIYSIKDTTINFIFGLHIYLLLKRRVVII